MLICIYLKIRFKCGGLHTIKIALFKNYHAFSSDLKAVYHHVDIFSNHHKYQAFSWNFGTGYVRHFNSRFCLLCFLVHLLFSQGFSNLWKPSGEDKEFQSLYFSMTALGRVPRWILLRLTVPLFAQIFHTVASKFTKKSSIGSPRENFLGLAIILTLKRGSVSQAVDP